MNTLESLYLNMPEDGSPEYDSAREKKVAQISEYLAAQELFLQATQCVDIFKEFTRQRRNRIALQARAAIANSRSVE